MMRKEIEHNMLVRDGGFRYNTSPSSFMCFEMKKKLSSVHCCSQFATDAMILVVKL